VEERPEPVIQGGTICVDFMTGEVLRTHTLDTGLDTTHSFQWFFNGTQIPGATGPSYEASEEGTYYVIAATANGCTSLPSAPVTIDLSGPPTAIGTGYSVSNYFSDNQVITINVDGFGEYEYRLDEGPWQESNIFTNVSAGEHTVYVRDMSTDSPCSEFVLALEGIMTVDYPRYFTPNGDGYHDRWNIKGLGDDNTDAKIYIFDRYGKLVKQISSQGDGWDGNHERHTDAGHRLLVYGTIPRNSERGIDCERVQGPLLTEKIETIHYNRKQAAIGSLFFYALSLL
jgi:gliding motility-associated-like protein